ncbi:MAG: hypothetical protein ABF289_06645 [Clostridiales bacterium]
MKNRPYVTINTKNLIKDFEKVLEKDLTKFKNLNGLVGITLNGGLSRVPRQLNPDQNWQNIFTHAT